jgi:hypothetical protein
MIPLTAICAGFGCLPLRTKPLVLLQIPRAFSRCGARSRDVLRSSEPERALLYPAVLCLGAGVHSGGGLGILRGTGLEGEVEPVVMSFCRRKRDPRFRGGVKCHVGSSRTRRIRHGVHDE